VVSRHAALRDHYDEAVGDYRVGYAFLMIECPACNNITLLRQEWHTGMDDAVPQQVDVVYPSQRPVTAGLPPVIQKAFEAAERVKSVDANAYGVLVRRGLELVCQNRGAKGRSLHDQLQDLGAKNEIPARLVTIAFGLKNLGNIGAHAGLGDLSPREVSLMDSLFDAILEHVYGAPHLIEVVERRIRELKTGRSAKSGSPSGGERSGT
jgi:hypothetical protein